jgi:hypothetical protein
LNWLYPLADDTTTWEHVWRAGGAAMYPLMLLALAALFVGPGLLALHLTVGRKRPTRKFGGLAMAYGVLAIGVGMLGLASGELSTRMTVASVSPEDKESVLEHGRAEAAVPLRLGLVIGVPMLLLGTGMFLTRRPRPEDAPTPATSGS